MGHILKLHQVPISLHTQPLRLSQNGGRDSFESNRGPGFAGGSIMLGFGNDAFDSAPCAKGSALEGTSGTASRFASG